MVFGIHHNNSDRKRLNVFVHLVSYLFVQYTLLFRLIIFKPAKCLNVAQFFKNTFKQSFLINCKPPKWSWCLVPKHTEYDRSHKVTTAHQRPRVHRSLQSKHNILTCLQVLLCDNLSLPFRDDSFDAVLSVAVVHHFATTERRVGALRELARVLRIGGRLIITVWAMKQRHRKVNALGATIRQRNPKLTNRQRSVI